MTKRPITKKPFGYKLNIELMDRLERYVGKQDVPVTKTAILEVALKEFLDRKEESRRGVRR